MIETYVAALAEVWDGLAAAVDGITESQWCLPTDLPGWSVKDNVAHLSSIEGLLAGEPYPSDHVLPDDLPHVRHEFARYMEVLVDVRRAWPGSAVLAELRDVTARRLAHLRTLTDADLDTEVSGELGNPLVLGAMLPRRVFDSWTHEQDVRRALGLPRALTTAGADISRQRLLRGLTTLGEDVPDVVGRTVVIETTGAMPSVSTLTYDPPLYADGDAPDADVRFTIDVETFLRLGAGRVAYDPSLVTIDGDVALGEALAKAFAITP